MTLMFQGDGLGGLAAAIGLASLCMVVLPALACGALGGRALRGRAPVAGWIGGAVIGGGLGFLAVTATFYESAWDPPLEIRFEAPPDFRHHTVFLLADPSVSTEIPWTGLDVPFSSPRAEMTLPSSGVVRVRSVDALSSHDRVAYLGGRRSYGFSSRPAPAELGATSLVSFDFEPYTGGEDGEDDPSALAERIRAREAGREPEATRYRVGDRVLYRYAGERVDGEVLLDERITAQDGARLHIEVRATRRPTSGPEETRRWVQVVTDTAENRDANQIDELWTIDEDGTRRQLPTDDEGRALLALYDWTVPPLEGAPTPLGSIEEERSIGGVTYRCTRERSSARAWGEDATLESSECPDFLWTHGAAALTAGDRVLWSVEVAEHASAAR
jgi:hypothetical protein